MMAELFDVPAVNKHLSNLFENSELDEKSLISILETTAADGKNYKKPSFTIQPLIHDA